MISTETAIVLGMAVLLVVLLWSAVSRHRLAKANVLEWVIDHGYALIACRRIFYLRCHWSRWFQFSRRQVFFRILVYGGEGEEREGIAACGDPVWGFARPYLVHVFWDDWLQQPRMKNQP